MRRVGWIHQFDQLASVGDVVSYVAGMGLDRVAVKALDGADWMAAYDASPLAISGVARVAELEKQLAAVGVGLDCWVNVTKAALAGEATAYRELIERFGGRLLLDLEPFAEFWGDDSDVSPLGQLLATLDRGRLGVTFDPRRPVWTGLDQVMSRASVALPQVYDLGWLALAEGLVGRWPGLAWEPLVTTEETPEAWAWIVGSPRFAAEAFGVWRLPIGDEGQRRFLRLVGGQGTGNGGQSGPALADADFRAYALQTGTWREAATNLKGVADDALATGRALVKQIGQLANASSDLWHGR